MTIGNTKFELTDPGFYDSLISDQKKKLGNDPQNAENWVELGRLQDEKNQMTKRFVQKSFIVKWLPISSFLPFFIVVYLCSMLFFHSRSLLLILPVLFCAFFITMIISARYPRSGRRYFKKALSIDPSNVDACMYLGLVALRRLQKKKAYFFLERTYEIGGDKKLERELKTIYQKEFMAFFVKKSEKEKQLYKTIAPLQNEIKSLKAEIENLKNKNLAYSRKNKIAKVRTGQTIKQTKFDMNCQMEKLQYKYEQQIARLEYEMEAEETKKELAQKENIRLNLEIMEAQEKKQSFDQAAKQIENEMGSKLWISLSKQTRSYLATAEHAFSVLDKTSIQTDFSLVGMELCKALEMEINRKLVCPFIKNLSDSKEKFLKINKTGESKGMPVYFTILAKVADSQNYPAITSLTLGQYLFVLKKTLEGDYALDEYGAYLDNIFESSNIVVGRKFLQKLRIVTCDYRNSIVHHTHMNHEQCTKLRELIYSEKDSLLVSCF